jgi:hypothetical protein
MGPVSTFVASSGSSERRGPSRWDVAVHVKVSVYDYVDVPVGGLGPKT